MHSERALMMESASDALLKPPLSHLQQLWLFSSRLSANVTITLLVSNTAARLPQALQSTGYHLHYLELYVLSNFQHQCLHFFIL